MAYQTRLKAEKAARVYLEMRGYQILEQNWGLGKNKIDVIAKNKNMIYFINLKLNKDLIDSAQVEILTESEINRFKMAAEAWLNENRWTGKYNYSILELAGQNFTVISFTTNFI